MRRYMTIAFAILVAALVVYVIGSAGSARRATPAVRQPTPPTQQTTITPTSATTSTPRTTSTSTTVITSTRSDCRWRQYPDGAISTDPACAPGQINPTVPGHTAHTICNRAWLAKASTTQPSTTTKDKLLIEYQLPGSPLIYIAADVIPVQDGGSPTSPLNLYPLPLGGWGGQQTRTIVADELHNQICSHRTTVARAAQLLESDWLSDGLPDTD
jgi:hypothetical protein